jgi:hypoxanthine phosphoribosyltransferase
MTDYNNKIKRVLYTEEQVAAAIKEAGRKISEKYAGKPLLLVGFLKGSFVFLADLMRAITIPCEMTFMGAKVYFPDEKNTNGTITVKLDVQQDVQNYHVLLVEDIIDTGRTIKEVVEVLQDRSPLSLEVITLVDKPECRMVEFQPDEALFTLGDVYVIGCGMDCGEHYRNLPYLAEYDRG